MVPPTKLDSMQLKFDASGNLIYGCELSGANVHGMEIHVADPEGNEVLVKHFTDGKLTSSQHEQHLNWINNAAAPLTGQTNWPVWLAKANRTKLPTLEDIPDPWPVK